MDNFEVKALELVAYLREKYKTNLPPNSEPDSGCLASGGTRPENTTLIQSLGFNGFVKQAKNARISPSGFINVNLSLVIGVEYNGMMVRQCYIELAKRIIEKNEWTYNPESDLETSDDEFSDEDDEDLSDEDEGFSDEDEDYSDNISELEDDETYQKFLITGSPGTGKSVFCLFFMILLVKANVPFFYNFSGKLGFFNGETHFMVNREFFNAVSVGIFKMFLYYNNLAHPPMNLVNSTNIVFSTPRKENYRQFEKEDTMVYYMPLWSREEIWKLNGFIPSGQGRLPNSILKYRFSWTGGVPQEIYDNWHNFKRSVKSAASGITPKQLGDIVLDNVLEKGPHCIIGAEVDVTNANESQRYTDFDCVFLSKRVLKAVVDHCTRNSLIDFILKYSDTFQNTSLLRAAYQEAVGRFFDKDHRIKLIALNSDARAMIESPIKEWEFTISTSERKFVKREEDIQSSNEKAQLWIPSSGMVDFIYTLPQPEEATPLVTLDMDHGIVHERLKSVVEYFDESFILVWAVGTDIFENFESQIQRRKNRNVPLEEMVSVAQFKMNMCHEAEEEETQNKKPRC